MESSTSPKNPMARVMSLRSFQILFAGTATSLLGDQFALIATPWLVLKLTNDPLILGIVLALEGIPRALFMLLGGVITDRISPRKVMLTADIIRFVLTGLMAMVVFLGITQIWMIYIFSLGFGLVAGFAVPAQNSIVPILVEEGDLQAGNSLIMGVSQLAGFVGPTVAGIIIGRYASSLMGVSIAFTVDSISFAVSAVCLWLIRIGKQTKSQADESVWTSIVAGIKYMWNDRVMRLAIIVILAVNFLIIGPIMVGIPVLANQRLPEGATAFGLLMSAYAGGNLAGYLIAGSLPRPNGPAMKLIMIVFIAAFGIVIGILSLIPSTWMDFGMLLILGLGNGYIAILMFTWLQTRAPREMLGRVMALMMFSSTGLVPISQAISGAVIKWNLDFLFIAAGILVLATTLWMAFQPALNEFGTRLSDIPSEA